MPESFEPEKIPLSKKKPLKEELRLLEKKMADRMDAYEDKRSDVHWKDDDSYHHIEKAFGELSLAYEKAKHGGSKDEMRQEAADAVNHILMALDIGPEEIPLNEKDIRTDKK